MDRQPACGFTPAASVHPARGTRAVSTPAGLLARGSSPVPPSRLAAMARGTRLAAHSCGGSSLALGHDPRVWLSRFSPCGPPASGTRVTHPREYAMIPRIEFEPNAAAPLDGIRVVDLSRLVAGNMVSLQLADQGAEVIKIEDPRTGDPLRAWRVKGLSLHWKVYARNKKSLALNLRPQAGRDALLRSAGAEPRADRELSSRHAGGDGTRPRRAARAQSGADHRAHHRLRPGRTVSRPSGLRHAGGGDVGLCLEERLRRPRRRCCRRWRWPTWWRDCTAPMR